MIVERETRGACIAGWSRSAVRLLHPREEDVCGSIGRFPKRKTSTCYSAAADSSPSPAIVLDLLVIASASRQSECYCYFVSGFCWKEFSCLNGWQVHLTVAIVDFLTPYKRRRQGICSSFFQSLDPQKDLNRVVPMWIKTGLFDPPSRDQDMLLIGPGTGLAAMRAIVQERKVLRATSASLGHTYLYFGSRHKHKVMVKMLWYHDATATEILYFYVVTGLSVWRGIDSPCSVGRPDSSPHGLLSRSGLQISFHFIIKD